MNKSPCVRFAPSPTGKLHLGGARTALFNWLYAKHNGGNFFLRIEDTDRNRLVKESINNIIQVLHWAGIDFDEGPHIDGGTKGPYIQSKRLEIYKQHMLELINKKHAYVCFYSDNRIEKMNNATITKESQAEYDKRFKDIDSNESISRMDNENCVVRLAMPKKGNLLILSISVQI